MLTIRLTRVSPTHHRLSYKRNDGSGEDILLETRSCLLHDLVHFAVESEAGLLNSFYGSLARAASNGELPSSHELLLTERIVGPLQNIADSDPSVILTAIQGLFAAYGDPVPAWCTHDLLIRVQNRVRQLRGQWNSTPFGQSMELQFRA
ncbi:MAG: hypothetical protein HY820_37800 [Acidobacteria bacterium]|nr:hypothetical protein [Acidobacteriota bacterium]